MVVTRRVVPRAGLASFGCSEYFTQDSDRQKLPVEGQGTPESDMDGCISWAKVSRESGRLLLWTVCWCLAGNHLSLAAPPRIPIDDAAGVQPAAFAEPDGAGEVARQLSPRHKPAEPRTRSASSPRKASGSSSLWGTVIGLLLVFVLFLGGKIWLTRHGPISLRGLPVEALELLGRRTLEPRVSLHIVRCGPKILVLGVGPDGVRTLTEITDPVEIDLMAGACRRKESTGNVKASFSGLMRKAESSDDFKRTGGA